MQPTATPTKATLLGVLRDLVVKEGDELRVADGLAAAPKNALIVTHAGVIRAARMILGGASFDAVFSEAVPYCTPIQIIEQPL